MIWKRNGGRKVIIAPDGGDAWEPAKPRPDETLIRALARAHRWKRLLEDGKYRSAAEIAEAEGITRSFVNRLLRLTLLAPDIQEAILDGRQPNGMQVEELTRVMPIGGRRKQLLAKPESGDTNFPGWGQGKRLSDNVGVEYAALRYHSPGAGRTRSRGFPCNLSIQCSGDWPRSMVSRINHRRGG
jgi:hypothetical protein